jgi:quinol monooxygenase YgiN
MALTATLEIRLKPELVESAYELLHAILIDTRAFEGCLGVEVLIDSADPAHLVAIERWRSAEDDAAYRAWRAGDGAAALGSLGSVLAGAPVLTIWDPSTAV